MIWQPDLKRRFANGRSLDAQTRVTGGYCDQVATQLDVYVSGGCENCVYARSLAAAAAAAFPQLRIRVLEVDQVRELPDEVFATPTYVLNGRVVSLGNPDEEHLFALLGEALKASVG